MATLLSDLIDAIEADLEDAGNTHFSAADIERWCRDAIADYSQYFPRQKTQDITTSANDREYDLDDGFRDAVSVEYPQGEDPPQYLKRRPYTHPDFWTEAGYYDIVPRADDTDVNEIYISEKPAASETIRVIYQGNHDKDIATNVNLTVPEAHHHILKSYVRWKAALNLTAQEEASPTSNSSLLMSQLANNTRRWEREYKNALAQAIQSGYGRSHIVSWANRSDESSRIY